MIKPRYKQKGTGIHHARIKQVKVESTTFTSVYTFDKVC